MFLEIKGIRKSYGTEENRVEVLKGIDLEVEKGQICVLLGQSGSGKSTLLNIIGGIDNADSGYVQHIIIKLQVIQRKAHAQLDLIRKQLLEFLQASAGRVGFRFDLNGENIILTLNQKIYLIRRIGLRPVTRCYFKLRDERLKHKVFGQRTLKLGEQAVALTESCGRKLRQTPQ